MMCIRGEADIQHTPANITSLHCSPQVEASSGGVIQSDVLVFIKQRREIIGPKKRFCELKPREDQFSLKYNFNQKQNLMKGTVNE